MRYLVLGMMLAACETGGPGGGGKDDIDETAEPVGVECKEPSSAGCGLDGVTCEYCEGVDTENGNLLVMWIDCTDGFRFGPSSSYGGVAGGHMEHCWPDTEEPSDSD